MRTLLVAAAPLAAAGLDPHVLDPGMPMVRAALAEDPGLQGYLLFNAILQSSFLLLGGFLADAFRSVRLVRIALVGLAVASLLAMLAADLGTLWFLRGVAWLCSGIIVPFAIGAVAVSTSGLNRATALGAAYGIYGAAMAISPVLVLLFGVGGPDWPAFVACSAVAILALVALRGVGSLRPATAGLRSGMAVVALFAFGVVAFAGGLIGVTAAGQLLRDGAVVVGLLAMGTALVIRGLSRRVNVPPIAFRPVFVALAAGVVVGFAQAAPLLHLPLLFEHVQGMPTILAVLGIAPFVLALLAAGPVSGYLLARFRPSTLIGGGVIAVGIANLILWLALSREMPYPLAIVPFALIGAGFVIATTVRTAVIFANMPSRMPALAVSFNEASIGLGTRLGVVVATVVTMQVALSALPRPPAGAMIAAQVPATVDTIRDLVLRIGLPSARELTAGLDPAAVRRAFDAVVEGMRMTELVLGVFAVLTGVAVLLLLRHEDPVGSVWELADERDPEGDGEYGAWALPAAPVRSQPGSRPAG